MSAGIRVVDVPITRPAWAWGRNREMRNPAVVTVSRVPDYGDEPTVHLSVYSQRGAVRGSSPIDLHLAPVDALALADAIRNAALGEKGDTE